MHHRHSHHQNQTLNLNLNWKRLANMTWKPAKNPKEVHKPGIEYAGTQV